MTDDNESIVRNLEELPPGTLVLVNDTGEVLRRTVQKAGSRYEWEKLVHEEDSYYMFSAEIAPILHEIIWNPDDHIEGFDEELRLLAKELSARTWVAPGLALTPNAQPATASFSKKDYPRILKAIEQSYTITLDCERQLLSNVDIDVAWLSLGYVSEAESRAGRLGGNMISQAFRDIMVSEPNALTDRFRTFVQPDGEIGLEITYFPLKPYDADTAIDVFSKTKLSNLMTLEQFIEAITNGAAWAEDCFGYTDIYELMFEVTLAGVPSSMNDQDYLLPLPILIQRKGLNYDVHVFEHED